MHLHVSKLKRCVETKGYFKSKERYTSSKKYTRETLLFSYTNHLCPTWEVMNVAIVDIFLAVFNICKKDTTDGIAAFT